VSQPDHPDHRGQPETDEALAALWRVMDQLETTYQETWSPQGEPVRVGPSVVVVPEGLPYSPRPGEAVIHLSTDPELCGTVFGTGLHPTTQLCLTFLQEVPVTGARVLDLGTGSGVLALAAMVLGAAEVLAVDTDPAATALARRNVALNGCPAIEIREGGLEVANGTYDLVLANVLDGVLIRIASELAARLRPGGVLIASGIHHLRAGEVAAAFREAGLRVVKEARGDRWAGLLCERP